MWSISSPGDGGASSAKCGKCGVALFIGQPPSLSAKMLEQQIAKSGVPVLVDVWSPWCGPCRAMEPEFARVARAAEQGARFLKPNSDDHQETAGSEIRSIPTMLLFRDGLEVARTSGAMSASQILDWWSSNL